MEANKAGKWCQEAVGSPRTLNPGGEGGGHLVQPWQRPQASSYMWKDRNMQPFHNEAVDQFLRNCFTSAYASLYPASVRV